MIPRETNPLVAFGLGILLALGLALGLALHACSEAEAAQTIGIQSPLMGRASTNSVSAAAFPLLAPSGTAGAPSYSFSADSSTGMYLNGAGTLQFTSNGGAQTLTLTSGGVTTNSVGYGLGGNSGNTVYGIGSNGSSTLLMNSPATGTNVPFTMHSTNSVTGTFMGVDNNGTSLFTISNNGTVQNIGRLQMISGGGSIVECTGAGSCTFQAASGQNVFVDEATAGTSSINIGTTNATTTNVGRSGQTTTVAGNISLSSSTVGSFTGEFVGLVTTGTNFGVFIAKIGSVSNLKFGEVGCLTTTTQGTGAAGTLIVRNVTDSTTACTLNSGTFNCASAVGTPVDEGNCGAAVTLGKLYSYELSGCTSFPTGFTCTTELDK